MRLLGRERSTDAVARALVAVAATGALLGIAAVIVGWQLAGHLHDGVDQSLQVADESLTTTDQSLAVVQRVLGDVQQTLGTVSNSVGTTAGVLRTTTGALDGVAGATPALVAGTADLQRNLTDLADVVATVEGVVGAVGRLPGVPDYVPKESLAASVRRLGPDLAPIVDALRAIDTNLGAIDRDVRPLAAQLDVLHDDLVRLGQDVDEGRTLIDSYRATATRAQAVARDTRAGLDGDLRRSRVLVVLVGLLFIAGQLVPLTLRALLLDRGSEGDDANARDDQVERGSRSTCSPM